MSRILLIETATEVCSAAIAVDGAVIALEEIANTQSHAALLTTQIDACAKKAGLKLSELDAVGLSSGPGSYTGLRVGSSVAKGICYALDKPLIAIDTLEALAYAAQVWNEEQGGEAAVFAPALDARRQEIWMALYGSNRQLLLPAQALVLENNSFENTWSRFVNEAGINRVLVSGNGANKIGSGQLEQDTVFFTKKMCSAAHLAILAEEKSQNIDYQNIAYFEPFYMKPPNITIPNNVMFSGKNTIE
jgi:tRNA threonylcarbamoyladenosine biosynthesis protein TsaB